MVSHPVTDSDSPSDRTGVGGVTEGVSKNSLQGESSSEENGGGAEFIKLEEVNAENIQQGSGGGDEFIELEEVNEHFKHVVQ